MEKRAFVALHSCVILLFTCFMVMSARTAATYYGEPFLLSLLDSGLLYGTFLGLTYFSYWLFIPRFIIRQAYWKFAAGFLVIVIGFSLCFNLVAMLVPLVLHRSFHLFVQSPFASIAGCAFVLGMAGTFFRLFVQWLTDVQEKNELQQQQVKSELALLKSQLNPHFLFNTLNNIDSLIIEQSAGASLALNKLSGIMRYVVYDSEKDLVPLEDEVSYIRDVINLQQLRLVDEAMVQFSVTGEVAGKYIAPMLFIPFVENAFKHASLKQEPGKGISISIAVAGSRLVFRCTNRIADNSSAQPGGVGLSIVKKRLELIYKERYALQVDRSGTQFSVLLNINL